MTNELEKNFTAELLDVAEPAAYAEDERDRNTHFLLTAWKELLAHRKKERAELAGRTPGKT